MPTQISSTLTSQTTAKNLNSFQTRQKELLDARASLDKEDNLLAAREPNLSETESKRRKAIAARIAEIQVEMDTLAKAETAIKTETAASSDVLKKAALEDISTSITKQIAQLPKQEPGTVTIAHPEISLKNIVAYITVTQHLNPYGRERQCDLDLIKIVGQLGLDVNSQVAEWIETGSALSKEVGGPDLAWYATSTQEAMNFMG